jgi:hypothetical protein
VLADKRLDARSKITSDIATAAAPAIPSSARIDLPVYRSGEVGLGLIGSRRFRTYEAKLRDLLYENP